MKYADKQQSMTQNESGNVLFLILIAIALFGALSFTMTQNQRGSTRYVQDQRIVTEVSRLLTHTGIIRAALHRMMSDGVTAATFSAEEPVADAATYVVAPHEHKIYHILGGGVTFIGSIGDASDIEINSDVTITDVGATPAAEIVLTTPVDGLRTCQEINMMLHGRTTIFEITDAAYTDLLGETAVTLSDATTCNAGGGCDAVAYQCVVNSSGAYAYYHVLHAE